MKRFCLTAASALLLLMVSAGAAKAAVLASAVRESSTTTVTKTASNLLLDESGNNSLSFSTDVAQPVVITYSTSCQLGYVGNAMWVIIYVDGVAASGTAAGTYGARYCTSDIQTASSRTVVASVGAGSHTVQVTGIVTGPSSYGATLRNAVLVVQN